MQPPKSQVALSSDVVQIAKEYPLLWEQAIEADTRYRMGWSVDPLDAECDAVLREIWMARKNLEASRAA